MEPYENYADKPVNKRLMEELKDMDEQLKGVKPIEFFRLKGANVFCGDEKIGPVELTFRAGGVEELDDPVTNPSHYTQGTIEPKDFIRDHDLNFNKGNAVKYVVRAGLKDGETEIEDLRKAMQYIQFEIDYLLKQGEDNA